MERTQQVLNELQALANPSSVAGMAHFGINPQGTLGISMPVLRQLARHLGKSYGKDPLLATGLWASGLHEARILASLVADPKKFTEAEMDAWVLDFDSWDVCDQVCGNLFVATPFAYAKVFAWSECPEEFVRRAGFVLMAELAMHDRKCPDDDFLPFFALIARFSDDERNFVKKAVNWALRGIGKRNRALNQKAIDAAQSLQSLPARSARWIAADAIRELTSVKVQARLK